MSATIRRSPWWALAGYLLAAAACAEIVGLDGEYELEGSEGKGGEPGSAGETPGGAPSDGGRPTGGSGGRGGVAGESAGGSGGEAASGAAAGDEAGGGSAGAGRGGAAGGGMGGTSGGIGGTSGSDAGGTSGNDAGGTSGASGGGASGTGGSAGGPPSCEGGLRTCGAQGDQDCCESLPVPGGTFSRGNDPAFPAMVSTFVLDRYEVTVARFRRFVAAYEAGYRPAAGSGKNPANAADPGWDPAFGELLPEDATALAGKQGGVRCSDTYETWTASPAGNEARPINCVSWYVAQAFCIWDGGRLPTEAEWNYAAAGGDEQRVYPWSDPPGDTIVAERHASYRVDDDRECGGDGMDGCAVTDFIRVGTRPDGDGRYGHADLAGNVYEWVQDRHAAYANPCVDCANLSLGEEGTIRGGCFVNYFALLQTSHRLNWERSEPSDGVGVRCARAS